MSEALAIPAAEVAQPAPQVVVAARELSRRYGEGETAVDALAGVSLAVSAGELTAVMGPSGSGKSTLMHILAGLDRPTAGQVWIDGTNITQVGDTQLTKLRRRHVGFIFQFFNLLPMLTAEENVVLPLELAGRKPERAWVDELLREAVSRYGQTTVMVTHDPNAAAIADRILFLADGRIVRQLGKSSAHEVLAAIEEVSAG